ncbi:MAG: alpha-ketoglutarate-dependent dioxygenase AlkB [Actinomycetota bacterium]
MEPLQGTLLGGAEPRLAPEPVFERVHLDEHSWVDVAREWMLGADVVLEHLVRTVQWRQHRRQMFGEIVDEPRLSAWCRDDEPLPHPALVPVRPALDDRYRVRLGSYSLNYYRNGRDSVAWHRDTEMRHLDRTVVAIVTLGATRPFLVRPHGGGASIDLHPASGDLLVMGGRAQAEWEHAVPKVARCGPRVSVMLRWTSRHGARTPAGAWSRAATRSVPARASQRGRGPR